MKVIKYSGPALMLSILSAVMFSSCVKKKEDSMREPAREMYLKSVTLAERYIDSISHAKDSTSLLSLIDKYDNNLTNLNYSYPPGADYELAEGENDTLKNLSARIIFLRDSLLYAYAHPLQTDTAVISHPDSISS